jgi:hypothetical protein
MEIRTCRGKCGKDLPITEFSQVGHYKNGKPKYKYYCKKCDYLKVKEWRQKNKQKRKKQAERHYNKHKNERLEYHKNHYQNNIENYKEYYQTNKDHIIQQHTEYSRKKYHSDPKFRLNSLMRKRVYQSVKGRKNGASWLNFVEYDITTLIKHLENQFVNNMSWDNYGSEWHIDHILPIDLFDIHEIGDDEFKRAWKLTNLQPLFAIDNIRKGNNIGEEWGNLDHYFEYIVDHIITDINEGWIELESYINNLVTYIIKNI